MRGPQNHTKNGGRLSVWRMAGSGWKLPDTAGRAGRLGQVTWVRVGVYEEGEETSGYRPRVRKGSCDVSVAVGPGPAGLMLEPRQNVVGE